MWYVLGFEDHVFGQRRPEISGAGEDEGKRTMKSRREFLKDAAAGAVLLGSGRRGEAGICRCSTQRGRQIKSCGCARCSLHGTGSQPDEQTRAEPAGQSDGRLYRTRETDGGMEEHRSRNIFAGKTIGLKVNGLGGEGFRRMRR